MTARTATLSLLAALLLAGCSESRVLNAMGAKTTGPQDNAVVGNQLSMPPDMQLRAPGTGAPPPASAPRTYAATPPVSAAPPADPYAAAPQTYAATPTPAPAPVTPVTQQKPKSRYPANYVAGANDITLKEKKPITQATYAEYGISPTKADGTPKTQAEMNEELAAAMKLRKQQQNPGYGTIFNIGNVFRND
jgi:hypothetical protein